MDEQRKTTPLHPWHVGQSASMACFGGYHMPLWYPAGAKAEHLPPPVRQAGSPSPLRPVKAMAAATGSREERQRRELIGALTEAGGNQSRAAELLGISRVTVWKRMKRYGVRAERQVRE